MGGRGSSSGGKIGGGGGGSALSAKMPTLTGSAKQVSWAESIRHDALANMDSLVKSAKSELGIGLPQGGRVSTKAADWAKKDLVSNLQKMTSASQIIDARRGLTSDSMRRRMIDVQLAANRGDLKL